MTTKQKEKKVSELKKQIRELDERISSADYIVRREGVTLLINRKPDGDHEFV